MRTRLARAATLLTLLLTSIPSANAQEQGDFALDQLDPAPAGDAFVGVPSPFVGGHLVPRGVAIFSYAHQPLVIGDGVNEGVVVSGQGLLHLGGSLALWDRLLVSASLPVALMQGGDSPVVQEVTFRSPEGGGIGDLRLGGRVRVFGEERDAFQIAGGFALHLPTGAGGVYVGEGAVRLSPQLILGGRAGMLVWSAALGGMFRSSDNPSTLTYGGGAAVMLAQDRVQVGAEILAATPLQNAFLQLSNTVMLERPIVTNAELLVSAKGWLWRGLWAGVAGGPGLSDAMGTPAFRALGSIGWAPSAEQKAEGPQDTDADGIVDAQDGCPYAFGPKSADPKKNGCPVLDDDEDGIPNEVDACPNKDGKPNADPKQNGCPPLLDSDGDGIADNVDACPGEKGVASGDAAKNGCPEKPAGPPPDADTDGDGVVDAKDACPKEKGAASEDAGASGCPKFVRVKEGVISTLEPVRFKISTKDPAPIDPASEPVLLELKEVIMQHPEWVKLEVAGHTDNTGSAKFNQMISEARAASVRKWLIKNGVPEERLSAKGYGPDKPIADNNTAEGREQNKRIEVIVVEKK